MFASTFGVELEMIHPTTEETARILRQVGLDCRAEGYNHQTRQWWKVVTDSSLSTGYNGSELVSPILQGEAGMAALRQAVTAMRDSRQGECDHSCGLHVHFGVKDLTVDQVRKVLKRFLRDEPFLNLCLPASRQGMRNLYCSDSLSRFPVHSASATPVALARTRQAWENLDACQDTYAMRNLLTCGDKMHKINTEPLPSGKQTIEIRAGAGSVDPDVVCNWVELLGNILDSAIAKAPRHWNPDNYGFATGKAVHYLALVADCSNDLRNYWIRKAEQIAAGGDWNVPLPTRQRAARQAVARTPRAAAPAWAAAPAIGPRENAALWFTGRVQEILESYQGDGFMTAEEVVQRIAADAATVRQAAGRLPVLDQIELDDRSTNDGFVEI